MTDDETQIQLAQDALNLAESAPEHMAASLDQIEGLLHGLYEQMGDESLEPAFQMLWTLIESIHVRATSQALGVVSVGLVATLHRMQRDEALLALQQATEAFEQLRTLAGGDS